MEAKVIQETREKFSLELDDANNLNTNLEYDGVYLNGYFRF